MYRTKAEFLSNLEKELGRLGITDKSEIIADFELHFADSTAKGLSDIEICAKLGSISEIAKQYAEEEIYPIIAVEKAKEQTAAEGAGSEEVPPPAAEEPQPTHFSTRDMPPPQNDAYADYVNSGIKINFFNKKSEQTAEAGNAGSTSAPPPRYNNPQANNYNNHNNYNNYNSSCSSFNVGGLITVLIVDIFVFSWAIPALFGIMVAFLAAPFGLVIGGIATMVGGAFGTAFFGFYSPFPGLVTFFVGLMILSLGGLFGLLGVQFVKLFVSAVKGIINWHGNMIAGRPVFKAREVSA
ncbi:MAG: DUF1700 domain-containing protein [Oscillospiraceae bacterium]|nr:DUF1700 domain-containing protein [Oscillospiraceae bacterium]